MKTRMKDPADPNTYCEVIEKTPHNRAGRPMAPEIYLRCSVQDYFVKFCESDVARQDLEPFIDKPAVLRTEIRNGEWDNCTGTPGAVQSRTGPYMVVKAIISSYTED